MPDQKPPRVHGGERETVLTLLQYQRESLLRKLDGADEAAAATPVVGSGATLLWLVKHMAGAETRWVAVRFAGQDRPLASDAIEPGDTIASVSSAYREAWADTDAIVGAAGLDDPCPGNPGDAPVRLR